MSKARRPLKARGKRDENERNLRELSLFVEEPGGFRLGLVGIDTPETRQTQLDRLSAMVAARPVHLTVLDLAKTRNETQLLQRLQAHLREDPAPEGKTPAVMVVGLESLLDYREPDPGVPGSQPVLRNANIQRDAFPRLCPAPVVFWLFPSALTFFAQEAPDLWHWRSGTFHFTGPPAHRRTLERDHVRMPKVESDRLPRSEKMERIALLRDLLFELENAEDGNTRGNKARRAGLLMELAWAYESVSKTQEMKRLALDALRLFREVGDRRGEGNALRGLGTAYADLGDAERAAGYYEQALAIDREVGDRWGEGAALTGLGDAYADLGDAERAAGYYEQALAIDREVGDRRGEGIDLTGLGNAYRVLGDAERAVGYYEQALAIHREVGDRRGEGSDLGNLGTAYAVLGDAERAVGCYEQALAIRREVGDRRGEGIDLGNLGLAYADVGFRRKAVELLNQSLQIAQEIHDLRLIKFAANALKRLGGAGKDPS